MHPSLKLRIMTYRFEDEPPRTMVVWGQIKIEDAILEARRSFADENQAERTE